MLLLWCVQFGQSKELLLTKFIISATLDQDKNLVLQNAPRQNQGENNCSAIEISLPESMAVGNDFYLEFLCPKNKRYISPKLSASEGTGGVQKLYCELPSCVLQEEGFVQFQLVAKSVSDDTVVFKSNYSNKTAFFVHASVNATQLFTVMDYFGKIDKALQAAERATQELASTKSQMERFLTDADELISQRTDEVFSEEKTARIAADSALQVGLSAHEGNAQNPHSVTKAQVGLETVANERQYSAQNPNFSEETPKMNGYATAGNATTYCRSDHVHPHDSTKADNNSVVKYTLQVKSEADKYRARVNIGAGTSNFSGNYEDLVNKPNFVGDTLVMSFGESKEFWVNSSETFQLMAGHGLGRVKLTFDTLEEEGTEFELSSGAAIVNLYVPSGCASALIETKNFFGEISFNLTYFDKEGDAFDGESLEFTEGISHTVNLCCLFYSDSWNAKILMDNIYSEAVYDR